MANDGFNGSTVNFAGATIGSLRGLSVSKTGADIPVHGAGDTSAQSVIGIPKTEITLDLVGGPVGGPGSTGGLTIAWFDGAALGTLTNAIIVSVDIKGQMDGEISSSVKFTQTIG
jgi:hypothetical protein